MAAVLCAIAPNAGHAVLQLMSASGQDIHTVEACLSRAAAALHRSARAALATAPVHPRAPLPLRALAHASCAPCMHTICACAGARVPIRQDARRRGEGAAVRRGAGAGTQTDRALPRPLILSLQYTRGRAAAARSRYAVVLGLLRKKKDAAAAVLEEAADPRRRSRSRSRTSQKGVTHARRINQESAAAAVDVRHAACSNRGSASGAPPPLLPRTLPAVEKMPAAVVGLHAQKTAASAPWRKRSRSSTSPWRSWLGRSTSRAAAASPAPPPPPPTVRAGC